MNTLVNKFCNLLMRSGNKTKANLLISQSLYLFFINREKKKIKSYSKFQNNSRSITIKNNIIYNSNTSKSKLTDHKDLEDSKNHKNHKDHKDLEDSKNHKNHKDHKDKVPITSLNPENILDKLIENVRPCLEIRKVRVARATYQVPAQLSKSKGQTIALRWIIESAQKRKLSLKISFAESLAQELDSAYKKQGNPRQRRNDLHRLAEANRSFMRYRWW